MEEALSYSEALPILLDLMQRRVIVVVSAHAIEDNAWAPIAILRGRLDSGDAEDLVEEGAPPEHFPAGESMILQVKSDNSPAVALVVVSETNFRGGQIDAEGCLGLYLGCAQVLISPEEEDN